MTNNMHNGAGSERAKNAQKEWMERDIAILVMFRDTGLRNTALSEINLSDIDFRNNKINRIIEKGAKRKEDGIIMSDDLRNALLVWTIKREKILKEKGVEEEALFISGKYRRLCEKSIRNIVKKYSKEYMGESISSHELRRVFCTTIYAETGDIELTRRLMGHEDIKTTQGYLGEMENPSQIASNIFNNISKRNIEVG